MYVEWFCACNFWFLIRGGLSLEGSLKGGTTVLTLKSPYYINYHNWDCILISEEL